MNEIDRDIAELEARIAEFRAIPHKELPVIAQDIERLTVSLPIETVRQIDRYRRQRPDLPSRAAAVRDLLAERLAQVLPAKREGRP